MSMEIKKVNLLPEVLPEGCPEFRNFNYGGRIAREFVGVSCNETFYSATTIYDIDGMVVAIESNRFNKENPITIRLEKPFLVSKLITGL